jgi:hypothetical protein
MPITVHTELAYLCASYNEVAQPYANYTTK